MRQIPPLAIHPNTERISTSLIPALTISSAKTSVINSPPETINFFVSGWKISFCEKRPTKRSYKGTITDLSSLLYNSVTTKPRSVPQSSSEIITSCATSTKRLVKYPESAVFKAVSVDPLRAPWVEIKNSDAVKPSLNEDLIGNSIVSPFGFDINPRIPTSCVKLDNDPRAPESDMMKIGLRSSASNSSLTTSCTWSFTSVHNLITFWYLSDSVNLPLL